MIVNWKRTWNMTMENLLDSLSEGKDYGSKVDALVDSMGVTENKVAHNHVRKDMDTL